MTVRRCGMAFAVLASLVCGFAQQAGSVERRMTLDVLVTDKSGKPASGLEEQDFTLVDNKRPQKIVSFQAATKADPPVEVTLLVDGVNTSYSAVGLERLQIEKFLKMNDGELPRPISIVFLSDLGVTPANTPSTDGNAIVAALDQKQSALRSIRRSAGAYGAEERLQTSLQALARFANDDTARPGRKLVIWISPGWPLLSGPNIELSSKNQQHIFSMIVAASDELRASRITLYAVDPLGTNDAVGYQTTEYKVFLKPAKNWRQAELGDLALQVLASQSGGRVLNSSNDIAGEIAKCVADANAYYVITFDSLSGDGPNEYHALDLKVDKPGLTVYTRAGYYAQP